MIENEARGIANLVFGIFFATWIVLGIIGFFAFFLNRDAAWKRKWFPRYVIFAGILFGLFVSTFAVAGSRSFTGLGVLVIVMPALLLISYLNIRITKFCDKCGVTLINHNWISPARFCSKCGAKLDAEKPSMADEI